jgi:hypothetical protein
LFHASSGNADSTVSEGLVMDAPELARWTRFAAKGGIGKCTAVQDCMAEASGDLMFLKVGHLVNPLI